MSFLSASQIRNLASAVSSSSSSASPLAIKETASEEPSFSIRALLQSSQIKVPVFPKEIANEELTQDTRAKAIEAAPAGEVRELLEPGQAGEIANQLFASMHNADKARVVRMGAMKRGFAASNKDWKICSVAYKNLPENASFIQREDAQNMLDGAAYYRDYFQAQLDHLEDNPTAKSAGRASSLKYASRMLGKSVDEVRLMFVAYVARLG